MSKNRNRAILLFLAALTLGLVTITFWRDRASEVFLEPTQLPLLSETIEITIYEGILTILAGLLIILAIKQLIRSNRWWPLFLVCLVSSAVLVVNADITLTPLFETLSLDFSLLTTLDVWKSTPLDALQMFEWRWIDVIVIGLLTSSLFLLVTLSVKAAKRKQQRWMIISYCSGLLITLISDNLYTLSTYSMFYFPHTLSEFLGFLWDAAPFLGLSALLLVVVIRPKDITVSRKIWWFGLVITLVLCLDLPTLFAEIKDIQANPGIEYLMHFQLTTPMLVMTALIVAIGLMSVALYREQRVWKAVPIASTVDIEHNTQLAIYSDAAAKKAEADDTFDLTITDLRDDIHL